jgi:hypothetical protein
METSRRKSAGAGAGFGTCKTTVGAADAPEAALYSPATASVQAVELSP